MKNRKVFLTLLVLGIGLVLFGTSYAFFEYVKVGANHELIAGDIYLDYNDSDSITIGSAFPESMKKARSKDDNFITFTVSGRNGSENDIYYEIDLMHGDEHSGLTRFNDKDLKFDLYEVTDTEDKLIIGGVSFDELNNTPIWVDKVATGGHFNYDLEVFGNYYALDKSDEGIENCQAFFYDFAGDSDYSDDGDNYFKACHNEGTVMGMDIPNLFNAYLGNAEMLEELDFVEIIENPQYIKETNNYNKEYKLRMWLNDDIIISDTELNADYLASDYKNHYASVKLKVNGSMEDREMPYSFMKDAFEVNYELRNIINDDESIKKMSFMKLDKSALESRYNNATSKINLTRDENATNRVYAWIEDDELIIASDKLIVLPELCGGYFTWSDSLFECLEYIETINFDNINTSRVRDFTSMFRNCRNLASLDLSTWDTYSGKYFIDFFGNCTNLASIDVSNWDTSNVTDMNNMFGGCTSLASIDLSNFDTSNVTAMDYMFGGCTSLTSLDVSHFDTTNVTTMASMFNSCSSLTSLDVSHFDTSNVNVMQQMFNGCSSLTNLDLSNFNTSNVTAMSGMFWECSNLTSLDLSSLDTSNVTDMNSMFEYCESLENVDLSSFDTSNVTDMKRMFRGCTSLTSLDLSSFNTSNVTDMYYMFYECPNLTTIYVGNNWSTTSVTRSDDMFDGTISLVGGNGTTYDSNYTDVSYAHVDEEDNPGYLTLKS